MAKQTGKDATLKIGPAGSQVTVGDLTSIALPKQSKEMVDSSTMSSTDHYKEFLPGTKDGGTLAIVGLFNGADAGQTAVMDAYDDDTLDDYEIALSNGDKWAAKAYVQDFDLTDAKDNEAIGFTATLRISGGVSYTKAASNNLSALVISDTTLVPAFAAATYEYVGTTVTGTESVTVTPTAAAGTITVNGSAVASGVASSAITLGAAGTVTDITVVVTETNKAPKTYEIHLARAAS